MEGLLLRDDVVETSAAVLELLASEDVTLRAEVLELLANGDVALQDNGNVRR